MTGKWRQVNPVCILPAAVFLNTFGWGFAQVSLPFYVRAISPGDIAYTLRWTGWIMGITPLLVLATTPLWIRWTRSWDPRKSFALADGLQGAALLMLCFIKTVTGVFAARLFLGLGGPANTFAFIIAGQSTRNVAWTISAMHSAVTAGILVAPLAGALAAAHFGYGPSFTLGAIVLWSSAGLVRLATPPAPEGDARARAGGRRTSWCAVFRVCFLILIGYSQVFFLNSILPEILPGLGIASGKTLEVGGWMLFASSVTLAAGALPAPLLTARHGEPRTLGYCLGLSCMALALLSLAADVWQFMALWLLHVLLVAPVFPIITARVVGWSGGQALGALNSSRVAANFLGPVVATTLLSWLPSQTVFLLLALLGLACLPIALQHRDEAVGVTPVA